MLLQVPGSMDLEARALQALYAFFKSIQSKCLRSIGWFGASSNGVDFRRLCLLIECPSVYVGRSFMNKGGFSRLNLTE